MSGVVTGTGDGSASLCTGEREAPQYRAGCTRGRCKGPKPYPGRFDSGTAHGMHAFLTARAGRGSVLSTSGRYRTTAQHYRWSAGRQAGHLDSMPWPRRDLGPWRPTHVSPLEEERMPKPKGTGFIPCTACGGSGATDATEIYTDKQGKQQTRKVRKMCTTCGGRGGTHI